MDFLDFLVDTHLKYDDPEIEEWKILTKKFLFYALDYVDSDFFLGYLEQPGTNFTRSKGDMLKTVNHFKVLKKMLSRFMKLNIKDINEKSRVWLKNSKSGPPAKILDLDQETKGDSYLVFKKCFHYYPVTFDEIQKSELKIFCSKCENQDEEDSSKLQFFLFFFSFENSIQKSGEGEKICLS